jgi:hypothetical protein
VLLAIPFFSPALCHIWGFVISVKGFREVFEISGRRAIFVTLFPMVLFFGTMLVGLLALGVALINMISLIL